MSALRLGHGDPSSKRHNARRAMIVRRVRAQLEAELRVVEEQERSDASREVTP